jgi:transposase
MGAPYSEDLRLRVLGAIDSGMSKMAAHKTFGISRSTIDDWLLLREQTGSVQANTTYQRNKPPALQDKPQIHAFFKRHQHSTQEQMALAWQEETGQRLAVMTFCKALRRLGYTRKKRAISTANAKKNNARASWSNSP